MTLEDKVHAFLPSCRSRCFRFLSSATSNGPTKTTGPKDGHARRSSGGAVREHRHEEV